MFDTGSGNIVVNVDGVNVITASNIIAGGSGTGPQAQFTFFGGPSSELYGYTDLIVRDTSGAYNNTLMGDRGVATLFVSADDVTHQGWTPRPLQLFGAGVLQQVTNAIGRVTAAQSTDFDFGSGDFTDEGWFRFVSLPTGSNKSQFFGKWQENNNNRSWRLYMGGPSLNNGNTRFEISTDGTAATVTAVIDWPWVPDINRWYHVAICRASGYTMFFIDGVMQGLPVADANTYFTASTTTSLMAQDANGSSVANTGLVGWQDEIRITKGFARYTASFVPAGPFPRGGSDPQWANVKWLSGWNSGVFDESGSARTLTARDGVVTVTPGDLGAAYKTLNKPAPPLDYTFIEAALLPATGILTMTAVPSDGETVTVATKDGTNAAVYRFKNTLAAAYDVKIGASVTDTLANLVNAVNAGTGSGTAYGAGTLANFDVSAAAYTVTQIQATANIAGAAGNSLASTSTAANATWGAATLQGGQNIPPYSQFYFQRPPLKTTIVDSVTLMSRAWKTDAGISSIRQSLIGPAGTAALGAVRPLGTAPSLYFDTFEVDPDTLAPLTPTTLINGKLRIDRTA